MPTSNPPADEVVQALAQMALLALALAAIVMATRAMQVSFDKRQAERARLEAVESARQRLKTLSDRNQIYRAAAASSPALSTIAHHLPDALLDDATGACGYGLGSTSSTFDSDSIMDYTDFGLCSGNSVCPTPAATGGGGGAASLLATASRVLQRRQASATLSPPYSERTGASGAYRGLNRSYSHSHGHAMGLGPVLAWQAHSQSAATSGSQAMLLRKNSDSLLETSWVLGSVPQETITSTRQVLAAFNYDYSALHRRESSYVSGTPAWNARQRP